MGLGAGQQNSNEVEGLGLTGHLSLLSLYIIMISYLHGTWGCWQKLLRANSERSGVTARVGCLVRKTRV